MLDIKMYYGDREVFLTRHLQDTKVTIVMEGALFIYCQGMIIRIIYETKLEEMGGEFIWRVTLHDVNFTRYNVKHSKETTESSFYHIQEHGQQKTYKGWKHPSPNLNKTL